MGGAGRLVGGQAGGLTDGLDSGARMESGGCAECRLHLTIFRLYLPPLFVSIHWTRTYPCIISLTEREQWLAVCLYISCLFCSSVVSLSLLPQPAPLIPFPILLFSSLPHLVAVKRLVGHVEGMGTRHGGPTTSTHVPQSPATIEGGWNGAGGVKSPLG